MPDPNITTSIGSDPFIPSLHYLHPSLSPFLLDTSIGSLGIIIGMLRTKLVKVMKWVWDGYMYAPHGSGASRHGRQTGDANDYNVHTHHYV